MDRTNCYNAKSCIAREKNRGLVQSNPPPPFWQDLNSLNVPKWCRWARADFRGWARYQFVDSSSFVYILYVVVDFVCWCTIVDFTRRGIPASVRTARLPLSQIPRHRHRIWNRRTWNVDHLCRPPVSTTCPPFGPEIWTSEPMIHVILSHIRCIMDQLLSKSFKHNAVKVIIKIFILHLPLLYQPINLFSLVTLYSPMANLTRIRKRRSILFFYLYMINQFLSV